MTVTVVLSPHDPFFRGKPFDWDGRLFTTIHDFERYLADPAVRKQLDAWANRVTLHHTYIPTVAQWSVAGPTKSLKGMVGYWRDVNGWTTGPNMIIAPEGIYLASGVDGPGIHAGVCNGDGVGIEIVGNYDKSYWREPILSFVFGATVALCHAMRMKPSHVISKKLVNGHRECLPNKTCPGKMIDMDKVRRDVVRLMDTPAQADAIVIGVRPSITVEQFKNYLAKYHAPVPPGELERIYIMGEWLEVDPAFVAACWKQEAFVDDPGDSLPETAIIGGSELQRQSHHPLNVTEPSDAHRPTVAYNNRMWRKLTTWQLGLMDALLYLKDIYGGAGLLTVRQIVPILAPGTDGSTSDQYVTNVLVRMKEMQSM